MDGRREITELIELIKQLNIEAADIQQECKQAAEQLRRGRKGQSCTSLSREECKLKNTKGCCTRHTGWWPSHYYQQSCTTCWYSQNKTCKQARQERGSDLGEPNWVQKDIYNHGLWKYNVATLQAPSQGIRKGPKDRYVYRSNKNAQCTRQ